ncbi:MAG TPA: hypothetical protein VFH07_07350 [Chitinophagaceae bacterium]|nr:hypothetical protein [Chitinophagaceae bacterium]
MHERPANNFGIAFLLATIIAIGTGILILALGKNGTFQLINGNHNEIADQFFKYFTHYGDGLMWAPLGAYCFFLQKKIFYCGGCWSFDLDHTSPVFKTGCLPG